MPLKAKLANMVHQIESENQKLIDELKDILRPEIMAHLPADKLHRLHEVAQEMNEATEKIRILKNQFLK